LEGSSISARNPAEPSTVNHYYRVLHTFFSWLKGESLISEDLFTNLKPPKTPEKAVIAFTANEIKQCWLIVTQSII